MRVGNQAQHGDVGALIGRAMLRRTFLPGGARRFMRRAKRPEFVPERLFHAAWRPKQTAALSMMHCRDDGYLVVRRPG